MKTCKDCVHYDVCHVVMIMGEIHKCAETMCKTFKDKSLVLDLPCKVGDTVYGVRHWSTRTKIYSFIAPDITWIIEHMNDFGKILYPTKESAEQALKEREHI